MFGTECTTMHTPNRDFSHERIIKVVWIKYFGRWSLILSTHRWLNVTVWKKSNLNEMKSIDRRSTPKMHENYSETKRIWALWFYSTRFDSIRIHHTWRPYWFEVYESVRHFSFVIHCGAWLTVLSQWIRKCLFIGVITLDEPFCTTIEI